MYKVSGYLKILCLIFILFSPFFSSQNSISLSYEADISDFETITESNPLNQLVKIENEYDKLIQSSEQFGDQEDFWVLNIDESGYIQIHATLLSVGTYCYIYMQNSSISTLGEEQAINRCDVIKNEFDSTIYPKNYELMGHPNGTLGDIDNDLHITVLLAETPAYYSPHNEIEGMPYSNNREMVHVLATAGIYHIISDVCHETNHLFLFNNDLEESVFVYEGLAEFSKYYAGYLSNASFLRGDMTFNTTMSTTYYSDNPEASLIFFDEAMEWYASYGISYFFFLYISEKYGNEVIKDLIPDDSLQGPEAIEHSLLNYGYNISFSDLYLDVITTCTIDELGIYDDHYGFINADFQISSRQIVSEYPKTFNNVKHRYYSAKIKELHNLPNDFTLIVQTPEFSTRSLGIVTIIHDVNGWYVDQQILPGTNSNEYLYFTGENILEVYVITSLVNEEISYAPDRFSASPYSRLNLTITSGHQKPGRTDGYTILSITSTFLVICFIIVKIRKRT